MADRLLADVGNTRCKWALAVDGDLQMGQAFPSATAHLREVMDRHWGALPAPAEVWVSNVAGSEVSRAISEWIAAQWNLQPRYPVAAAKTLGVCTLYRNPERLGVDRWLALLAARRICSGAACVVDCGTAMTFDVLNDQGVHLGGLIAPGLRLMEQSLKERLPGLQLTEARYQGVLALDTGTGILSGTLQAAVGLIERSVADATLVLSAAPDLILTGGDADRLQAHLRDPCRWAPHLVLEGLMFLAECNQ